MKRVLIAGATGYLGRHLVNEFNANGWEVHALTRNAAQAVAAGLPAAKILQGQATDPADLAGKFDNIDLVISTLGITRQRDGLSYMDVDYQANVNLLNAAESAGVQRFCYIHVLNAAQMHQVALVAAKHAFAERLRAASIASTIVSPSGYFSDMGDFLEMAKVGRVYLFGKGNKRLNPIDGADLAAVVRKCIKDECPEISVGGPEVYSQTEIARLAFASLDKPTKITYLPSFILRIGLWGLTTFTRQEFYGPYQFFLTALQMDMVGKKFGARRLPDHFADCISKAQPLSIDGRQKATK